MPCWPKLTFFQTMRWGDAVAEWHEAQPSQTDFKSKQYLRSFDAILRLKKVHLQT